jgi:hypothetical protein
MGWTKTISATGEQVAYMNVSKPSIARGTSVVVVTAFLGVLGWYLLQPGYQWTRLGLFVVLGALAVASMVGVWYHRERVVAGGIAGLLLLTASVAGTLWMAILPVVVVLGAATVFAAKHEQASTPFTG